ncbi:MAG: NYN domain-containing protein, partial [Acidimicrobiales bacterium]
MSLPRVVVDGSNIATEGRSTPSLRQLDEAVRSFKAERPGHEIIVVVDATFAHRIDDEERPEFEEAASHNELVYPPAGAIGRGDAFLLAIADRTDALVLSNDSFQEFHGEYDWLFDKGRLIGGMPVRGVGWVFVERNPVRGPKSREAVRVAKRTKARVGSKEASNPMPKPKAPPPGGKKKGASRPDKDVLKAIDEATEAAVDPKAASGAKKRRRRNRGGGDGDSPKTQVGGSDRPAQNEPLAFIEFIAEHKLGSTVQGVVDQFSSHGAFIDVDGVRCYVPLTAMGEPAPRSAKEALTKGEEREFVIQALDAPRRGIELALPGFEHVSGHPTEETVEAEISESEQPRRRSKRRRPPRVKPASVSSTSGDDAAASPGPGAKKIAAKKAGAKQKTGAAKKAAAKKAPSKGSAKETTVRATAAKKAPAKKAPAKKAP